MHTINQPTGSIEEAGRLPPQSKPTPLLYGDKDKELLLIIDYV
jgi:hypothetical protein